MDLETEANERIYIVITEFAHTGGAFVASETIIFPPLTASPPLLVVRFVTCNSYHLSYFENRVWLERQKVCTISQLAF
jgi:hypothetical protein